MSLPPAKRPHTAISVAQKKQICEWRLANPHSSIDDTREYATHALHINIGRSTVTDIWKERKKWLEQIPNTCRTICVRPAEEQRLEGALSFWLTDVLSRGMPISDELLLEKAKEFGKELGVTELGYSRGWLSNFKRRHGVPVLQNSSGNTKAEINTADPPAKRPRTEVTVAQKQQICEWRLVNPRSTIDDTREYAKRELHINIGRSTVTDIWKDRIKWLGQIVVNCGAVRMRPAKQERLEAALSLWLADVIGQGIHVSDALLIERAKLFGNELGVTDFGYSRGWLFNFKKRYGLLPPQDNNQTEGAAIDLQIGQNSGPDLASHLKVCNLARRSGFQFSQNNNYNMETSIGLTMGHASDFVVKLFNEAAVPGSSKRHGLTPFQNNSKNIEAQSVKMEWNTTPECSVDPTVPDVPADDEQNTGSASSTEDDSHNSEISSLPESHYEARTAVVTLLNYIDDRSGPKAEQIRENLRDVLRYIENDKTSES